MGSPFQLLEIFQKSNLTFYPVYTSLEHQITQPQQVSMKLLLIVFILFISIGAAKAQSASDTSKDTRIFVKVEIESEFPGGQVAWRKFLAENFRYPRKAVKKGIEGTVIVQFIVDRDGMIEDVQAIAGPEILRESAVEIIKKSPKWIPATQGGRKVKSYKKQPITYKLTG